VLDEVDAPLDEANVRRFVILLKEFAETSQFIVVTHNKVTMAEANTLYGVTMQERGVSKRVAVELETYDPEKMEAMAATVREG
jgi:chromosome segregation protein